MEQVFTYWIWNRISKVQNESHEKLVFNWILGILGSVEKFVLQNGNFISWRLFFTHTNYKGNRRDFKNENHNNKQFCFKESFPSNHSLRLENSQREPKNYIEERKARQEENETLLNIIGKTCWTNEYIFLCCFVIYCYFRVQTKFEPRTG